MYPRITTLDILGRELTVSTYGFLVALGITLGIYLGYRRAKQVGIKTDDYLDLSFWGLMMALLGSRLLYAATNLSRFTDQPLKIFAFWEGGLVFYGGVLAALATAFYFVWRRHLPYLRTADVYGPVLALGHAFGRLGCYMVGCCWGKVAPASLGVQFGRESVVWDHLASKGHVAATSTHTPFLYPVQLYEAVGELIIFSMLLLVARRKRFDGQVILSYLLGYGCLRLCTELFRGDKARRFLFEAPVPPLARLLGLPEKEPLLLSTSQFVAIITIAAAIAGLVWLGRRQRARRAAAPDVTVEDTPEDTGGE